MLDKLQNAPRATRQKWFVVLSIIAGAVLVFFWIQYLGWSLQRANLEAEGTELNEGFGPLESLKGLGGSFYGGSAQ